MPVTQLRPYAGTPTWTFDGRHDGDRVGDDRSTHQSGAIGPG